MPFVHAIERAYGDDGAWGICWPLRGLNEKIRTMMWRRFQGQSLVPEYAKALV